MPQPPKGLSSEEFDRLREEQDDVVSRAQFAEIKISRQPIGRRLRAKVWQAIGPHVVVLHAGPTSRNQQLWAGVLHAGPGAALTAWTALEAEGLTGVGRSEVHTVAPHGTGRRRLVWNGLEIVVHESRKLGTAEMHPLLQPPRVRRTRAALDAASFAGSDRAAQVVLAAAVQQRLVTAGALREAAMARPNLARHALILETLDDIEGGSHSLPELEFLRGLRRHRMPMPTRQRVVRHPSGRYYLDADFDDWLVTVEINGVQHLTLAHKEADDMRRTRLAIGGRLVVDISSWAVRHDIALAVLLTADALRSRGWRPDDVLAAHLMAVADAHPSFDWTHPWAA